MGECLCFVVYQAQAIFALRESSYILIIGLSLTKSRILYESTSAICGTGVIITTFRPLYRILYYYISKIIFDLQFIFNL